MTVRRVALIEAFYTGSHKTWARDLQKQFPHLQIDLFTLPGRFWKWRMNSGAAILAEQFNAENTTYDLILATSMVDLPLFLALTRTKSAGIPVYYYFHENQLAYPWSRQDREKQRANDQHYI
ncbi:MAG: tRNA-queuosine alpha-mannosyltransferase domain-containing protein, partial [Fibrobacterota bacterium]